MKLSRKKLAQNRMITLSPSLVRPEGTRLFDESISIPFPASFDTFGNQFIIQKNSLTMTIKTHLIWSSLCFLFLLVQETSAQQLLIVNGGSFGSATEKANLGVFNASTGLYTHIDTIYTNSVQDVLIEADRYAYVAAQDSIVKYDLWSGQRLAATAFGATSTIKLGLHNNVLLVGNWYGLTVANLRIFDKNTLNYQYSIPEITKGAQDFIVIGDDLYISQNNTSSSWSDTLGYLAVVDLSTGGFVRNDTLSNMGEEVGRLVNVGDSAIYSLNNVSNTISYYHIPTGNSNTVMAAAVLAPKSYGGTAYKNGLNSWYIPFNNGIGTYDLVNNNIISGDIINTNGWDGTAFAVDTVNNQIYLSYINYVNQSLNQGVYYNSNGDSLGTFPVGISPEVLAVWYNSVNVATISSPSPFSFSFQAFPNPAIDRLSIQANSDIKAIRISDLQGRVLSFQELSPSQGAELRLTELPAGHYFLTVWDIFNQASSQPISIIR